MTVAEAISHLAALYHIETIEYPLSGDHLTTVCKLAL